MPKIKNIKNLAQEDTEPENTNPEENPETFQEENQTSDIQELFTSKKGSIEYLRVYRFPTRDDESSLQMNSTIYVCQIAIDECPTLPEVFDKIRSYRPKGGRFKIESRDIKNRLVAGYKLVTLDGIPEDGRDHIQNQNRNVTISEILEALSKNKQQNNDTDLTAKYKEILEMNKSQMEAVINSFKMVSEMKIDALETNMKMREAVTKTQFEMQKQMHEQNMEVTKTLFKIENQEDVPGWLKLLIENLSPYIPVLAKVFQSGGNKLNKIVTDLSKKPQVVVNKAETIQIIEEKEKMKTENMWKDSLIKILDKIKNNVLLDDIAEQIFALAVLGEKKKELWDFLKQENIRFEIKKLIPDRERDLVLYQGEIDDVLTIVYDLLEPSFVDETEENQEGEKQENPENEINEIVDKNTVG